jgi:hypothetical protein
MKIKKTMKRVISISPGSSRHDKSVKMNLAGEEGLRLKAAVMNY